MKLVVFGLSVSSSWGNGHATLWRGLTAALARAGHHVVFFERDVPYYASHRDVTELSGGAKLILYSDWQQAFWAAQSHLADADVGIVTSYCPDGIAATEVVLNSRAEMKVFYDLDTPVTLSRLAAGEDVGYIGPRGLADFDLVLSYTGGRSVEELGRRLGAKSVAPLYGSVDPDLHKPVPPNPSYYGVLGYLGTYAADRQDALRALFIEPAKRLPHDRFLLAGSMFDGSFPWHPNIYYINHLPPADHAAFYCSTRLTLNVTRRPMAEMGYCPSARLFEATACGSTVLTDYWDGLEEFFTPGSEILLAADTEDAMSALDRSPEELARIGRAAREHTLSKHTATVRVAELEKILENARAGDLKSSAAEVV